ncbi:MAG: hypothetical protein HQL12_02285 [Candidatus Omnitrophica bacterium]|nr:hypothetical protein [Candidatus Omnitrophota bacterium]
MLRRLTIVILFSLLGLTRACFASVSLSVSPVDGSNGLRFERVPVAGAENKKEIHIRVSSTNGNRYQVFQRILEPIVNEKGDALNLQAIVTQTLPNSNSAGSLYLQNSDHLTMGDQLLYSSSQSGASDSFMIGYALDNNLFNTSGSFRGRIVFTLRGIGNSSSDQVTLDVMLETPSSLKISVKGAHNLDRIHIKSSDTSDKTADFINVSFSGNSGQEIRIYQETENFLENQTDEGLGVGLLQLDAQGEGEGLRIQGLSSFGFGRTLIYSSNKTEDNFVIYFLVNADQAQNQAAGSYDGKIKYIVETAQGQKEFPINVHCEILPVFTMNITAPPGGVNFAHVIANNPPQNKEVLITVSSNLHKSYQVLQGLQTGMTNQQGKEFNNKYFNIQVEIPSGQKGRTDFTEFSPVQTGEYPIFTSDSYGSGASFTVVYRLQGYARMSPGDFSVPIRFSLNQK